MNQKYVLARESLASTIGHMVLVGFRIHSMSEVSNSFYRAIMFCRLAATMREGGGEKRYILTTLRRDGMEWDGIEKRR